MTPFWGKFLTSDPCMSWLLTAGWLSLKDIYFAGKIVVHLCSICFFSNHLNYFEITLPCMFENFKYEFPRIWLMTSTACIKTVTRKICTKNSVQKINSRKILSRETSTRTKFCPRHLYERQFCTKKIVPSYNSVREIHVQEDWAQGQFCPRQFWPRK